MEDITASLPTREHVLIFSSTQRVHRDRSFWVICHFCFSQDKKEGKIHLLTWDVLVMVKPASSFSCGVFCKHSGKLVNILYLLLSNQPLCSFIHPVNLFVLIFGSRPSEEDEQISSFILTGGGKATLLLLVQQVKARSACLCTKLSVAAVCVSGRWQRHWLRRHRHLPPRKTNDGQIFD